MRALLADTDATDADEDCETFDFNLPEDVLIKVIHEGEDWSIEEAIVLHREGPAGAATYEDQCGGFLEYTIKDMIERPAEGWHVVMGITGFYTRGDGWTIDDNMSFYCKGVRSATADEINQT